MAARQYAARQNAWGSPTHGTLPPGRSLWSLTPEQQALENMSPLASHARYFVPDCLSPGYLRTLEFHGFKPVDIRPGTNGKIAIIGRPMGGKTIPGKDGRPLGVHDYAESLRKLGYEVEVYTPLQPSDLRQMKLEILKAEGKPVTQQALDAIRFDDDVIKGTQSYKRNMEWAAKMRDEGYTVIDLGNNTGAPELGAFYAGEAQILFPNRGK